MGSPESSRSHGRREMDENSDVKSDRVRDDEEWESSDKKKHRSSKSRKVSTGEDAEVSESSGKRRSSTDKNDSRKRSSGSGKACSDDDDYETRKELRSRQMKKKQEESTLEKLSNWYQDGDLENKQDKSGSRGYNRADDGEKQKMLSKVSDHENVQTRSKSKEDKFHDEEAEKMMAKDSRYTGRRESSREKGHGSSELLKNPRRRWDESDTVRKSEESGHIEKADLRNGKDSDPKDEGNKERRLSERLESSESKNRGLKSSGDKGLKLNTKEEKRVDPERSKSRSRSEAPEDDSAVSPLACEDKSIKEKNEKPRQQRNLGVDVVESRDKSPYANEDDKTWIGDRVGREEQFNRSRTPERTTPDRGGRRHQELENSEMDYDRSNSFKRKEYEKDSYRDDRSKGRDDNWSDRNKDRENSKESWKRRQPSSHDKETKDREFVYEHGRDWELPRHGRERADGERPQGRSGGRKDGRTEAVKTSSNYGISNENYDVIEIQTKPLDYRGDEFGSSFARRTEAAQLSEVQSVPNDEESLYLREEKLKRSDINGPGLSGDDSKERYNDDAMPIRDQNSWRDDIDSQGGRPRGQKGSISSRKANVPSTGSNSHPIYANQDQVSFNRSTPQGPKVGRGGKGGRVRPTGRDGQQVNMPLPMMGSPFGPLGMPPPGPLQPLNPNMSPAPGPPINPGVFLPPFSPPVVWAGPRGVDMNVLAVPPGLSPVPPGPAGPRFSPNIGNAPNPAMYFNQPGSGRGMPPPISSPAISAIVPGGRGQPHDKAPGAWVPNRSNGLPGKAPSRGEQNDYSQNFVDTGMRPQNFIRELELTHVVEDYPKLRELIQKKDEIVAKAASPPMYCKCDLREHVLSPEFFGTKFDVILVDPPWEEYVHRAPGVADHTECWTFEEIQNLKIEAVADTPSFIFLWVGDGVGLEQGRQCLKKWGFRRCEDICWVKTNKTNAAPGLRHDSHTLFQHSKEHCLMGIRGTVRRSTDGHIIHANIDTDVIIAEEPPYGSTAKPEDMYRIIEHFALGRRRLELFGGDHNIRSGWLTVGKGLSSSNFNAEAYIRNFCDKDGKVWQGGGGRNPPPESPHLVLTTPDIEALRPKSPMKNQQQIQQSASISLTTANSTNKRPSTGNSPQNPTSLTLNQEASGSNPSTPAPWASPFEAFKGREGSSFVSDDRIYDIHGHNPACGLPNGEYMDFESHRAMNMY